MKFSHTLARGAKVWSAKFADGTTRRILVVVTTLELNPSHKRYKEKMVERLTGAAQEYLSLSDAADGYLLTNRFRDWDVEDV